MTNIPDAALQEMLQSLPESQRRSYAHIISGKISHQVHCDSDDCKGDVIAYLYIDGTDSKGRIKYHVEPAIAENGTMKLRASRARLDGEFGFECVCGADTRIATHEAGAIGYDSKPPTRQGLQGIYSRLRKSPPRYPEVDGVKEVDGFRIERLS